MKIFSELEGEWIDLHMPSLRHGFKLQIVSIDSEAGRYLVRVNTWLEGVELKSNTTWLDFETLKRLLPESVTTKAIRNKIFTLEKLLQ